MKNKLKNTKKSTHKYESVSKEKVLTSLNKNLVDENTILLAKLQNEVADYYSKIFERLNAISSI
jgi:hypothetical protein